MENFETVKGMCKAQNPKMNSNLQEAKHLQDWLRLMGVPVGEIKLNPYGISAAMNLIPLSEVEGEIPEKEPLALQLEVNGNHIAVALAIPFVAFQGAYEGLLALCKQVEFDFKESVEKPAAVVMMKQKAADTWKL